jgi:hypothetical protein
VVEKATGGEKEKTRKLSSEPRIMMIKKRKRLPRQGNQDAVGHQSHRGNGGTPRQGGKGVVGWEKRLWKETRGKTRMLSSEHRIKMRKGHPTSKPRPQGRSGGNPRHQGIDKTTAGTHQEHGRPRYTPIGTKAKKAFPKGAPLSPGNPQEGPETRPSWQVAPPVTPRGIP